MGIVGMTRIDMESEKEVLGLMPGVIVKKEETEENIGITFKSANGFPWVMRLTPGGQVQFNREAYPKLCPDDFAKEVVNILEEMFVRYDKL